jgi:hypothetical protein
MGIRHNGRVSGAPRNYPVKNTQRAYGNGGGPGDADFLQWRDAQRWRTDGGLAHCQVVSAGGGSRARLGIDRSEPDSQHKWHAAVARFRECRGSQSAPSCHSSIGDQRASGVAK